MSVWHRVRSRPWLWLAGLLTIVGIAFAGVIGFREVRAGRHYREALAAIDRHDLEAAGEHLAICGEAWPADGEILFLIAQTARRSGIRDFAEEEYDACLRVDPSRAEDVRLERTLLDFQTGSVSPDREQLLLSRSREGVPGRLLALEALGYGYARIYRIEKAREAFDLVLAERPANVPVRMRRAWCLERLEQNDQAEADYREVLERQPDEPTARLRLPQILLQLGKLEEARERFEELLADRPEDPAVIVGLSQTLAKLGKLERARELLDAMLARSPRDTFALTERGKLDFQLGDAPSAERWLRRATDSDPHDYEARYQLVLCLRKLPDATDLAAQEKRLKEIEADVKRMYDLTIALQSRPSDPDLASEIGRIFLRRGEDREGLLWLNGVLQSHPRHAPTRQALAQHFDKVGQPQVAAEYRSFLPK